MGAVTSMNTAKVANARKDFALFDAQPELAFLDTAASAQKPKQVLAAIEDCYAQHYANIHRGVYKLSQEATMAYEGARKTVAEFINADEREIIFTRNATESINLVASTWGRQNLKAGDVVLLSELEHHANIVPWHMLRDELGIELRIIPMTDEGGITLDAFKSVLDDKVKLLAITHMSNALGTCPPVAEMVKLCKAKGITTLVDGCQAVIHNIVDVKALGCDFFVFSGHKLYGPTGIGVLFGRYDLLEAMPPYQGGGDMIRTVTFDKVTYVPAPGKFEAGTPHIAGAVGLAAAIDYLNSYGRENIFAYEDELYAYATEQLQSIEGLTLYGTDVSRKAVLSFAVDGIHPHDMGTILDQYGVCVRAGHHCAQPLMKRLGVPATTRASVGIYNNKADVDRLVKAINKAKELFHG
ncbi:MAG: cysteine desulfurase CsdA [Magnetococcales bacterium]|nr:cysteine desulfurase CsdA [Magnetococcales bacterium]|tara:strand:+ start:23238 stop:24470 length:1233 start_codon:yes stop_codon:yes gene_type:complete